MAGRATVYLQARTHSGVIDPGALAALLAVWVHDFGADTLQALDDLYARLMWVKDGDVDMLSTLAAGYRELIGEPDSAAQSPGQQSGEDVRGHPSPAPSRASLKTGTPAARTLAATPRVEGETTDANRLGHPRRRAGAGHRG